MKSRAGALVVAVALGAAGCGSSPEESTTSSTSNPESTSTTAGVSTASSTTEPDETEQPSPTTGADDADRVPPPPKFDGTPGWKPSLTRTYEVTVTRDVVYGQGQVDGGGAFADLLLDLYVPEVDGQGIFPLVVTIHGGGFRGGSKDNAEFVSDRLAQRGYIVASIDYRVRDDAAVPTSRVEPIYDSLGRPEPSTVENAVVAAIDDTMTALDFLHARPDVEPSQTVLWGNSAGAITALFVGYGMDEFDIERPPVAAVVSNSGGFIGERPAADFIDENRGVINDPPYLYSEGPIFMTHATGDTEVAYQLSQDIVDRAVAIGHPHERFTVEADSHGLPGGLFNTEYSPGITVFQAQVNWLDGFLVGGSG